MEPLLTIENVHKTFGQTPVLQDVNLSLASGEVVAIIGPSGSGKSTLLRCINHLEVPESGRITMRAAITEKKIEAAKIKAASTSVKSESELDQLRQKIGMVFQNFNLFPHLTVLQNITIAPIHVLKQSPRDAQTEALQLLQRVGMADKAGEYPSKLSGGQQQRVAIARALAMHPQLMLFDEVTSALDPVLSHEVLRVMRDLAQSGMTMIVVTHELHFARDVAQRIIFMSEGRILEDRRTEDFFQKPEHPQAQHFLRLAQGFPH